MCCHRGWLVVQTPAGRNPLAALGPMRVQEAALQPAGPSRPSGRDSTLGSGPRPVHDHISYCGPRTLWSQGAAPPQLICALQVLTTSCG